LSNDKPQDAEAAEHTHELLSRLGHLVEAQEREQDLKQAELQVKSSEITSNERVALASIEAQSTFHRERFGGYNKLVRMRLIFVAVFLTLILGFCLIAINLGAKELVIDLAKLMVPLIVGAVGGYGFGRSNTNRSAPENSDE